VVTEQILEMLLLAVGPLLQCRFGLGLPGQDAFDRFGCEGAVADRAFLGSDHILGCIDGQQGQDTVRLGKLGLAVAWTSRDD
jgi:hypothetical protein